VTDVSCYMHPQPGTRQTCDAIWPHRIPDNAVMLRTKAPITLVQCIKRLPGAPIIANPPSE